MTIAEIAALSGLSIDTIRFYEKEGLLPPIPRDGRGWRVFTPDAIDWLVTLGRLRRTGMPLADMTAFARSAHGPDAETRAQEIMRRNLLAAHAARLAGKRADLDACAAYLAKKIAIYGKD
ncbi:MerR family transcriptional regulator [Octadecabacter sp. R77987]|uniref:MerR family transcriptional regulator n=1 Tax=Octadecabacter sp. R77987 TaxID=3093874 RepID=UPI003672B669